MSDNSIDWESKIVGALLDDRTAISGRAGETPLSALANELEQLSTESARLAAVAAIGKLVVSGANEFPNLVDSEESRKEFWRSMALLTKFLPNPEKESLASIFKSKLFDSNMRQQGLSVHALHGLMAANGRLTPAELERLGDIRKHAPIAWLGAAVMSSLFDVARENTLKLLKEDRLDLSTFLVGLDSWRETWDRHENFGNIIREFRNSTPTPQGKEKFTKWLERRGFLPEKENEHSENPTEEIWGKILEFKRNQPSLEWHMPQPTNQSKFK